jgi:hypothetical protein
MGARTTLSRLIPTAPHVKHAVSKGNSPAAMLTTLDNHLQDCITIANHLIDDMRRANPNDPNISTITTIVATLS